MLDKLAVDAIEKREGQYKKKISELDLLHPGGGFGEDVWKGVKSGIEERQSSSSGGGQSSSGGGLVRRSVDLASLLAGIEFTCDLS